MEKRTLEHLTTVRPPEVSASLICLEEVIEELASLSKDVVTVSGFSSYANDFLALAYRLEHVQSLLTSCRRPVDPQHLRSVLLNSLQAQS